MIGALLRVPGYRLMHAFGFPRMKPINMTISTTFRCNSRCLTCNVYERPVVELDAEEWDKVFRSLGRSVMWFTFSGGEPFLRKDLVEIIESAWRRCRPSVVNIPTNGTFPERVLPGVERLAKTLRGTQLVINVSLDAVGERNDEIRGYKKDYELATRTFRELKAPFHVAFLESAAGLGLPFLSDPDDPARPTGAARLPVNIDGETRWNTALRANEFEGWWLDPRSKDFGPNAK